MVIQGAGNILVGGKNLIFICVFSVGRSGGGSSSESTKIKTISTKIKAIETKLSKVERQKRYIDKRLANILTTIRRLKNRKLALRQAIEAREARNPYGLYDEVTAGLEGRLYNIRISLTRANRRRQQLSTVSQRLYQQKQDLSRKLRTAKEKRARMNAAWNKWVKDTEEGLF